jgi:hypothetical protein
MWSLKHVSEERRKSWWVVWAGESSFYRHRKLGMWKEFRENDSSWLQASVSSLCRS